MTSGAIPSLLLGYHLSLACSLPSEAGWLVAEPQGPSWFCISDARITKVCYHTQSFHMDFGDQTQVLAYRASI